MNIDTAVSALQRALEADERVSAAILFGSVAKGLARRTSDLDVALVARSPQDALALNRDYLDLAARLSLAARRDVHLTLLDGAEPELGRQVFLHGRALFDRDPRRTAGILERITLEYFDGEYHRRLRSEALRQRREARHG
jgi:predicted nucleotidyltransferase